MVFLDFRSAGVPPAPTVLPVGALLAAPQLATVSAHHGIDLLLFTAHF
jgi:hypothetical protein